MPPKKNQGKKPPHSASPAPEHIRQSVRRINLVPMDHIAGYDVRPGFYEINGATAIPTGINFTVHSVHATSCELLLFQRGGSQPFAVLPMPDHYRVGNVWSMIVFQLEMHDFEYAYRLDGPYDPAKGLLFAKNNILLDPYAKAVTGQQEWGIAKEPGTPYKARVVEHDFDWGDFEEPHLPVDELIIYEAHVRGFTQHPSSGVQHPGTFAGLMEKLPYLKELGITAVELMPIFEFDEMADLRVVDGKNLINYWGYNTVCFFAPNTGYTAGIELNHEGNELKQLVKALNENGIEVILDVVFNHTAEGNEHGPCFSFKGFDNNIYYMLTPDGHYYNFSSTGNTLNCNHPIVQQMILECLRHWVINYRVDGFRFDLASILGRNEDGSPMSKPPLLQNLAFDPILANVKLIAEAWDAGGLYQVGSFPAWRRWGEWNGRYRDDMRAFLKGDGGQAEAAAQRIAGSPDLYDPAKRGPNPSVNFITCHDGFTLYDLYSYNQKHNEANGWNNTDGADDNRSWNCGAEGGTDNTEILKLRHRLIKNAVAVLLCSRGTPMLLAGDEFCNTQYGNNNPYCQDNEISWLNWEELEKNRDTFDFFKYMIDFRKAHAVVRRPTAPAACGMPDVSFHTENPWDSNYGDDTRIIGVMFAGADSNGKDDVVYIGINAFWEQRSIHLPQLPQGHAWRLAVHTGAEDPAGCIPREVEPLPRVTDAVDMPPRSVVVLTAAKND